jgi:hypothetical protein
MHRRSVEFTTRFKEVLARIDGIAGAKTRETTARENTQRFTPACSACRFPSATRSPEAITSLSTSAPYLRSHGLRVLTICLVFIGAIAASVAMQSTRSESFTTCATPGKGVCTLMPSTHNVVRKNRGAFPRCILPAFLPVPHQLMPSIIYDIRLYHDVCLSVHASPPCRIQRAETQNG